MERSTNNDFVEQITIELLKMNIKEKIAIKLQEALCCEYLEVIDESHLHIGHGNTDRDTETHFKIIIKATKLNNFSRVKAHQKIYQILVEEMKYIHALAITLKTA